MTSRNHPISSIESLLHVQPFIEGDPETDVFVDQPDHADNQQALNALTGQGGRLFGGITLGQSLNAAQQTVSPDLVAHSMHCTFVSGRLATVGVQYHIERVKDGRQFCARLVRAVQNRRTFFLALVNFANLTKFSTKTDGLQYGLDFPHDVPTPPAAYDVDVGSKSTIPFLHHSVGIRTSGTDQDSSSSSNTPTRIHQWMRAREPISDHNGLNKDAHLAALACMSDAYLLAGAPHTHGIYDFVSPPVSEVYDGDHRLSLFSKTHQPIPRPHLGFPGAGGGGDLAVTSMASLDHSLYFHDPVRLRADQWLLCEIHSSWAGGGGRALVHMKIWGRDGTLVASCSQEGLVSLGDKPKESKL
ncbi:acyl-CoA thioesterase [Sporothrix stenoceras]|uniref:Acyl-CoA thioesterase n=1 Tax=Sporothrix stenoceras TaxID=5173 RepID=A0ABR3YSJ0_9PEZI